MRQPSFGCRASGGRGAFGLFLMLLGGHRVWAEGPAAPGAFAADALIFRKGVEWATQYDAAALTAADRELIARAEARAMQRRDALRDGKAPWNDTKGKKVHGYVSKVDGSIQPYGVIVPSGYDPTKPMRLDVVLHGSQKPVGMSELRFIARFDTPDEAPAAAPDVPYLELHPLGRVENCYRWAGETDVFEAIADACGRYNVDRSRIVLRGMSMGASGTWHLGLKHPGFFAALGPYCGYVDTHRFSETPLPNFVKVGPLPEHQERMLHMLDSVDYAGNAAVVPVVAAMGEKDVFFQAHVIMGEAFRREKLELVNLISPGTGHVVDPVTHAEQLRQIAKHLIPRGRALEPDSEVGNDGQRDAAHNRQQLRGPIPPDELRFVTWTLKYAQCHWIQLHGLDRHYDRAEIVARCRDGVVDVAKAENLRRFAVLAEELGSPIQAVRIGGVEIALPPPRHSDGVPHVRWIERDRNSWRLSADDAKDGGVAPQKRPGLQGPIDDAFTSPFVCVRPTGKPWNAEVHAAAVARLDQFAKEWRQYFRGECPLKNDVEVTEDDLRTRNLILFGDPGSNRWIARALPSLPIQWTRNSLRLGGANYDAARHLPALIAPSPLSGGHGRYVVLNSGHTFGEAELAKLNYLLFPRQGDWAVFRLPPSTSSDRVDPSDLVKTGFFDETWK